MPHENTLTTLITPIILTFNEQNNIERQLQSLVAFDSVIIIDSFSTDNTIEICQRFENVTVFQRRFDNFKNQWSYAISLDNIKTSWVLALDADYCLNPEVFKEIFVKITSPENKHISGYYCQFKYCIDGKVIKGSIYPPVTILYKRNQAKYIQDGHTQRVNVAGEVKPLTHHVLHDDRKSFDHWLTSQYRYAQQEALKLATKTNTELGWKDKLRKFGLGPILVPFYVIASGALFSGKYGLIYIAQRTIAESLLAINLWRGTDKLDINQNK